MTKPASDANVPAGSPCIATAMRKASRRLSQLYDDALAPTGLRSTQFAILAELASFTDGPPSMVELAEALVTDRSSLGHNLRPLERDGLVALEASEEDRRRRHVVLTTKGRAALKAGVLRWQIAQDRFHEVFGAAEAARLRATLLRVAHNERLATLKG
ncbi:MAG: MarR family winged helix-turn-helix transcriptional regulator [Gemmatimonadota bacterium]